MKVAPVSAANAILLMHVSLIVGLGRSVLIVGRFATAIIPVSS
jgi:hypothetical protein